LPVWQVINLISFAGGRSSATPGSFNDNVAAEANRKRSEAQIGIPKAEIKERAPSTKGQTSRDHDTDTATAKAKASTTSRAAIERAAE
jgi:hypothetical protein